MTLMHPGRSSGSQLRLHGNRVLLRPLVPQDFAGWSDVRRRNGEWLTDWEPARSPHLPDPESDRDLFAARCAARDRERLAGTQYAFGIFVDGTFAGEINLNNVMRGAMQTASVGYWIDRERAGRSYMPESFVVVAAFAFEDLGLHRLEVAIIPRNSRSRRVVEKVGLREEGLAEGFLEINGTWEDHLRFGMTSEEWEARRTELSSAWLGH